MPAHDWISNLLVNYITGSMWVGCQLSLLLLIAVHLTSSLHTPVPLHPGLGSPSPSTSVIEFSVEGEPLALMRHRIAQGRMYNPSSSAQKTFLRLCSPSLPAAPWEGPVAMTATFYFSRPKSHFRTGKFAHVLKPDAPLWHTNRNGKLNASSHLMRSTTQSIS